MSEFLNYNLLDLPCELDRRLLNGDPNKPSVFNVFDLRNVDAVCEAVTKLNPKRDINEKSSIDNHTALHTLFKSY